MRNDDDSLSYGYKAVWLQEIIDNKGVIVALDIAPINAHDLTVARPMVEAFNFEPGSTLIADRGFIDGAWITSLKQDHGVDVVIPLRHNMDVVQAAIATADNRKLWEPHPTRAGQYVAQVNVEKGYLLWNECPVLQSAALVRWPQKDGTLAEVLFVSTKPRQKPAQILAIYDQRAEIEESHRQMKEYLGIERLPSKKLSHVIFRILMGVLGFNLMALFLSSEDCKDFEQYSLKTLRQRRPMDPNPKFVIYTQTAFAVLRFREFMPFVLLLDESVRKRIAALFSKVGQSAGAAAVSGYD